MTTPPPDLSSRPHACVVEQDMKASPSQLYRGWTRDFDAWFAAPGTVAMDARVGAPFFFETHFEGARHPHYGRFLELVPDQVVELTWVTGTPGTGGAETVLRVELSPRDGGTHLVLTHSGFTDEEACTGHAGAWPLGLELLDQAMLGAPD